MVNTPYIKPDRPSPEQVAAWRRMTFEQKVELSDQLRRSALQIREAWLRKQDPTITDEQVRRKLREFILYGSA